MDGNHAFDGKWLGTGPKPSLVKRIANGDWPYARPHPQKWRPRTFAPPFGLLHPRLQHLFSQAFQDGHGDPQQRPDASKWHQALSDVESDRAYVKKLTRQFRKAAWRAAAPSTGQSHGHASNPNGYAKRVLRHQPIQLLHRLAFLCRRHAKPVVCALLLTAGLAVGFYLGSGHSRVTKGSRSGKTPTTRGPGHRHPDPPLRQHQPTPQLWKALRDLSLEPASRSSDGHLLNSLKEHE